MIIQYTNKQTMNIIESRRAFLHRLAAGGSGAVLAGQLWSVHEAFAQQLETASWAARQDDFEALREHYLLDETVVYLNHASIGTMSSPVHEARGKYVHLCETNPWLYLWGGAWEEPREQVRGSAADFMGCTADEVAITHNTTEMFNVLAHGLPWQAGDEVLFSTLCHAGASLPFEQFAEDYGYRARRFDFPVDRVPHMAAADVVDAYAAQIRPETRLLVIPHIDNTVGVRYPVQKMARMARDRGVEFVAVDGAQAVGMIPVDVASYDVDVYATSPHKWLQSAKGLGLAYIHTRMLPVLRPMWVTWGQQRWAGSVRVFEDYGTRNFPELLSLGDAIAFAMTVSPAQRERRLQFLWQHASDTVAGHEDLSWHSPRQWDRGCSLFAIGVKRPAAEVAKQLFQQHQIVVRPFDTLGLNALRVSPNVFNTPAEIDRLVDHLVA